MPLLHMWAYMLPGRLVLQFIGFTARHGKDFLNVSIECESFLALITLAWLLSLQLKSFFFPTIPASYFDVLFKTIKEALMAFWDSLTPMSRFFPSQPCRATECFKNRRYLLVLRLQRQNESWKAVNETQVREQAEDWL